MPEAANLALFPDNANPSAPISVIEGAVSHEQSTAKASDTITATHLVVIDRDVENHAAIKAAIESRTDGVWTVHVLDNSHDPIGSISTLLNSHSNIDALHLITHGQDGELSFSGRTIDNMSLLQQADDVSIWNQSLSKGADILVYGCDIAASDTGKAMVDSLAHLTGANVAASDDATGHTIDNADWMLEYHVGTVDSASVFMDAVQDELVSTLGDYFVTTTNETGPGSLSQAISDINGDPGGGTITFQVGGTFTLNSLLPAIREPVVIDATQVSGYAGTPLVFLRGESAPGPAFEFTGNSDGSMLQGVAITGFNGVGILIDNVDGVTIEANYIGTTGVIDSGVANNSIQINSSNNTTIKDNLIAAGNRDGVYMIDSSQSSITDNVFRDLGDEGIQVAGTTSVDNSFLRNVFIDIFSQEIDLGNAGRTANDLGVQDADLGSNNLQNYPVLHNAFTNENDTISVSFSLDSAASTDFRIEFYSSVDPFSVERFIGYVDVTTSASGIVNQTVSFTEDVATNDFVFATATEILAADTYGSTSEFSFPEFIFFNPNTAPTISNADAQSSDENQAVVTTVTAIDPDPDTLTFSIIGGNDAALFNIGASSGVLSFISAPDKESPTDRTYEVEVQVSDGIATDSKTFNVDINDINEFSVTIPVDQNATANEVTENAAIGVSTGLRISANDADISDSVTYSLTYNAGGRFSIDASGNIRVAAALDAETASNHAVVVRASSTDGSFEENTFIIDILDLNESPLGAVSDSNALANAVNENATIGTEVGLTANAIDPDRDDQVSYVLTDDAGGLFSIDSDTGVVTVAGTLDAEMASSHTITVQASSTRSGTTTTDFIINITDINESGVTVPVDQNTSADQVAENAAVGELVGITALAADSDTTDTVSYSLANDAGGRFSIDSNGIVRVAAPLDAESASSHQITIQATSSDGSTATRDIVIAIVDVDESPISTISDIDTANNAIVENSPVGSTVGIQASATDTDISDIVQYSLTENAGGRFSIDSNTGVVTLVGSVDAETSETHTITVQATSSNSGISQTSFVITVTDFNEFNVTAPVDINALANNIDENSPLGSFVGIQASAVDFDVSDTVSYSLTGGNGLFAIDSIGRIFVAGELDAEISNQHTVVVAARSSDGSVMTTTFDIQVNNLDDQAPAVTASQILTLTENVDGPLLIGTLDANDADTGTALGDWRIESGNEDNLFELDPNNGNLYLTAGSSANFEARSEFSLGVSVSDGMNRSSSEQVLIRIIDVNEAPFLGSVNITTNEDLPLSLTISSTLIDNSHDPEGDELSLSSFAQGQHGTVHDNGNGELIYTPEPNFHGTDRFEYTLIDGDGHASVGHVDITVIAINDAPDIVVASTITVNENSDTVNANIQASDIDGDTLRFSLSGDDAARFTIDEQSGDIRFREVADFELPADSNTDNVYKLAVVVSDAEGESRSDTISIAVQDANDLHAATADSIHVIENMAGILGVIAVQDQDVGDTHTFEIIESDAGHALQIDELGQIEQIESLSAGDYYLDVAVRDQTGSEVVLRLDFRVETRIGIDLGAANPVTGAGNNGIEGSPGTGTGTQSTSPSAATGKPTANGTSDNIYGPNGGDRVPIHSPGSGTMNTAQSNEQSTVPTSVVDVRSALDEAFSEANLVAGGSLNRIPHASSDRSIAYSDSTSGGRQLTLNLLLQAAAENEISIDSLSASFDTPFSEFDLSPQLLNAIQRLNQNLEDQLEQSTRMKELVVSSVTVVTGSLSVGLLTWLLKSGSLMATALTTSPLWRAIDPIPVLANREREERRNDKSR